MTTFEDFIKVYPFTIEFLEALDKSKDEAKKILEEYVPPVSKNSSNNNSRGVYSEQNAFLEALEEQGYMDCQGIRNKHAGNVDGFAKHLRPYVTTEGKSVVKGGGRSKPNSVWNHTTFNQTGNGNVGVIGNDNNVDVHNSFSDNDIDKILNLVLSNSSFFPPKTISTINEGLSTKKSKKEILGEVFGVVKALAPAVPELASMLT